MRTVDILEEIELKGCKANTKNIRDKEESHSGFMLHTIRRPYFLHRYFTILILAYLKNGSTGVMDI